MQKAIRALRSTGPRGLAQRAVRAGYNKLGADVLEEPLLPGDIADSTRPDLAVPAVGVGPGRRLVIGWITTPPGLGSGGHTTMFRMVQHLEAAGHTCVLYLYDRYGGDLAPQEAVIRRGWPDVRAEVRSMNSGLRDLDACFATSWPTAHVLARHGQSAMQRLYFIQDFEPFFYARGSEYALAEDSYRFGFHNVALGGMVADCLQSIGVRSERVEFGCDTSVYGTIQPPRRRSGVVFYTRPGVPRRGYQLGSLALQEFHIRHPEQPIHLYGARSQGHAFPAIHHEHMTPVELNVLYNEMVAGLAMSFTNISLVAEEMLAAGAVPVVNDSPLARADLPNPHVVWAPPTPHGIADGLSRIVEAERPASDVEAAARSVRQDNWDPAGADLVRIVEKVTYQR